MTTKEKIKDAFIALIIEKQTVKISVKDIVKRAKISRRSFYNYYADRQSITEDIYIETIESTIKECFDKKMTTEMFITEIYKAFFNTIIERNQIVFSYLYKDIIQDQIKLDYLSYKYASTQVMLLKKWLNNGMVESPEFMTEVYLDSHKNYENMHESIINKKTNW